MFDPAHCSSFVHSFYRAYGGTVYGSYGSPVYVGAECGANERALDICSYACTIYVGPDKCSVDINADERADTRAVPYWSTNQCTLTTSGQRAGRGTIQRPRR